MPARFRGGDDLHRRLEAITDTRALLRKLQTDTAAEAKRLVPRRTGNLGRTIHPAYLSSREALVRASAGYAAAVEIGTKPHIIRPRNKQVLRFPAGGAGTTLGGRVRTGEVRRLGAGAYVFAREVHHPGTKPHPFLLPGAQKAAKGLDDIVIDRWNKAG